MKIEIDQTPSAGAILQEYLEALAPVLALPDSPAKTFEILRAYGEVRFRLLGGGHCALCHAHVRHVLPIIAEHADGQSQEFDCLCTRCFEGERAASRKMIVHVGKSAVEFLNSAPVVAESGSPEMLRPDRIVF